ncbi:MAG: response regulator [Candidatus Aminicenantes bacterium]|nr:response regulator [Candidatus Aminicenantes bacterium]
MPTSKIHKPVNPRILIVEDNRINQLLLMKKFEQQGLTSISLARDGQEAMAMALENNPDLILMDIQLPDMNGNLVIERLREEKFSGQIVALSADALPADKARSLKAGANGYITKPIDFDTFFVQLNDFLSVPGGTKKTTRAGDTKKPFAAPASLSGKINADVSAAAKNVFISDGLEKLQILAAALAHTDDETHLAKIKAIAHEYKGNAGYFGLKELEGIARELDMGFANHEPDEHLVNLTRQLVAVVEHIIHENS